MSALQWCILKQNEQCLKLLLEQLRPGVASKAKPRADQTRSIIALTGTGTLVDDVTHRK